MEASRYRLIFLVGLVFLYVLDYLQLLQTRLYPFFEINFITLPLAESKFAFLISGLVYVGSFIALAFLTKQYLKANKFSVVKALAIFIVLFDIFILFIYFHNFVYIDELRSQLTPLYNSSSEACYSILSSPSQMYCEFLQNQTGYLFPIPSQLGEKFI